MDSIHVLLETSEGDMLAVLYPEAAPKTVANFLAYVDEGHYNETLFHRIVRGFVVQGGGYDRFWVKKPVKEPVPNEAHNGLSNRKGTLAMARTPEKDSARDEFFINAADNTALDHRDETDEGFGYSVFGELVEGFDVLKKINWKVVKARPDFPEAPQEEVVLYSVQRFA
ncbi:peptidylprolyl isomerase [Desulfohalobium retbaense]|uniref:Peptidyl-prolyl cis-trans isomerase n=1 Tax=Desulfohalobium retbaense (strain ATCC 49708 / DSM 5692 / JCM 16813 / HR100) TaxID=485915 RepID=C8X1V9_DESRD|nr:peptidylprolyl isomerase [Desulfohalobium retbaense]ACV68531.1 peptidyl-prolyl cis-trans isomerase cyclophilin type [Desulfohalobium retbaense DSM 5692]